MASNAPHTRYAAEAARLLGAQVQLARRGRRWTLRGLAERAGVSINTIRKVEAGDMTVALGTALDVAALLRVPLFHEDQSRVRVEMELMSARLALLPQRVRALPAEVHDDF